MFALYLIFQQLNIAELLNEAYFGAVAGVRQKIEEFGVKAVFEARGMAEMGDNWSPLHYGAMNDQPDIINLFVGRSEKLSMKQEEQGIIKLLVGRSERLSTKQEGWPRWAIIGVPFITRRLTINREVSFNSQVSVRGYQ